jgi:ABC-2 type transport system ATP-binding protein
VAGEGDVGALDALVLSHAGKRFTRRGPWVLREVNLALPPATVTVVVAGNGSGKSTLMRLAAGVSRPTSGVVRRGGPVGYAPERLAAGGRMDAATYLSHMGRLRAMDARLVHRRSRELFERLGLRPGPHVPIEALSKGNRQKVVLAQAFLAPVALLVLDEPLSGLDAPAAEQVRWLIDEARAAGTSALLSAHQRHLAGPADAVWLLESGQLHPPSAAVSAAPTARPQPSRLPTVTRLVLRARDGASVPGLSSCPGVLSVEDDHATQEVTVRTVDADLVLRCGLAAGWSFLSGQPEVSAEGGSLR